MKKSRNEQIPVDIRERTAFLEESAMDAIGLGEEARRKAPCSIDWTYAPKNIDGGDGGDGGDVELASINKSKFVVRTSSPMSKLEELEEISTVVVLETEVKQLKNKIKELEVKGKKTTEQMGRQQQQMEKQQNQIDMLLKRIGVAVNKSPAKAVNKSSTHQRIHTVIPSGWERHVADGGGSYYEDPNGEVQWEKPPGQGGGEEVEWNQNPNQNKIQDI